MVEIRPVNYYITVVTGKYQPGKRESFRLMSMLAAQ
jgi:hypothetical protein